MSGRARPNQPLHDELEAIRQHTMRSISPIPDYSVEILFNIEDGDYSIEERWDREAQMHPSWDRIHAWVSTLFQFAAQYPAEDAGEFLESIVLDTRKTEIDKWDLVARVELREVSLEAETFLRARGGPISFLRVLDRSATPASAFPEAPILLWLWLLRVSRGRSVRAAIRASQLVARAAASPLFNVGDPKTHLTGPLQIMRVLEGEGYVLPLETDPLELESPHFHDFDGDGSPC